MRDFKEPYYSGPECVCCKKPMVELELDDLGEELVRKIQNDTLDVVLAVLRQERLEWGFGTMAARMIDGLIIRIKEKF